MKKLKRTLGFLLALTMVFGLWSLTYAVEGSDVTLSLSFSQPGVKVGESVTLRIEADRDFSSRGSGMTLCYDDAVLEPELEASSAAAPLQIHAVTVGGKAALRISFLPGAEPVVFGQTVQCGRIAV